MELWKINLIVKTMNAEGKKKMNAGIERSWLNIVTRVKCKENWCAAVSAARQLPESAPLFMVILGSEMHLAISIVQPFPTSICSFQPPLSFAPSNILFLPSSSPPLSSGCEMVLSSFFNPVC